MRTELKDQEYFKTYFESQLDDIEYYNDALENGEVKEDRILAVRRKIFTISLHTLIAKYSSGYAVSELRNEFENVVTAFEHGWKDRGNTPEDNMYFDNYLLVLWMLSLGFLLDIESSAFERIVKVLDDSGRKDFFFDYIIKSRLSSRSISEEIIYPDQFLFLKELIKTKDISKMKIYLDKQWYKRMKLTYWYDNHKSKTNTFFGYWSFESGALVKILGLDDSLLKSQQYYPYDMVHWQD
ncbi:PoNe immunity protein domain-containing protein [Porphyromonas macacae]|uniref:PoNe immunity protein domain-containing protein n=1 Tax=Porphyromonas macacae TaxID=28115 RepID=UPI0024AD8864|nr:PoNe immunity protein domain-containing protein [Porphyromonas macacae]